MQKKDDKVGNNKRGKEGEKGAREKERKRLAKRVQILALRMHEKQKKRFHFFRLVEKYAFFLQNTFSAIPMLISQKPVQRRGIGEKMRFFYCYLPAVIKGLNQICKMSA